jgi:hypothetical protein
MSWRGRGREALTPEVQLNLLLRSRSIARTLTEGLANLVRVTRREVRERTLDELLDEIPAKTTVVVGEAARCRLSASYDATVDGSEPSEC